ncbi:hypothetical protein Cni_G22212 [Canna indica]|uniref:Uncharacterized protein n=1 Tax=Canna indica TaxID=4628 RepID=A0AAQ3QLG0_9LILI|nr:hypothetical protein Cni_G22212 [Canna indica]
MMVFYDGPAVSDGETKTITVQCQQENSKRNVFIKIFMVPKSHKDQNIKEIAKMINYFHDMTSIPDLKKLITNHNVHCTTSYNLCAANTTSYDNYDKLAKTIKTCNI